MGDVFDRWRLNCGWNPWDDLTQEAAIASFVHSLDRENVPEIYYGELYERVIELRKKALVNGKEIPRFGVELMLACWHQLRVEIREREIERGRTLTGQAQSQCLDCEGTGMQIRRDAQGKALGRKPGCTHESFEEGERTMDGFEVVEEALRRPTPEETALDILKRLSRSVHYELITAIDGATEEKMWAVSRILAHATKYCRENPEGGA